MPEPPAPPGPTRSFAFLVGALTAAHTSGTVAILSLAALAPVAAPAFGVPVYLIGYQSSLMSSGIIVSLLFGANLCLRWGACRVTQSGLALLAGGSLLTTIPHLAFLAIGSLLLGMGYGLLTPAASHVLIRHTPPNRRNVVFSVKQSGVPLGGVIAAIGVPAIAVAAGWQWAIVAVACVLAVMAVIVAPGRTYWDADRDASAPLASRPAVAIGMVWRHPTLLPLGIAGGCFVAAQMCMNAYTVAMFYDELSLTLIEAGLVLSAAQAGGVAGRLFWGWLADRWRDCAGVLAVLGATMAAACFAIGFISLDWPLAIAVALFVVLGATSSGWNGAYLGEVARLAPHGHVGTATGGTLFFVNIASVSAPILFANVYAYTHSYGIAFGLLAAPALVAIACLVAVRSRLSRPART